MSARTRGDLSLYVYVTPTGDNAYAEDAESAITCARELLRDARAAGCGDPRASFVSTATGELVRGDVKRSELVTVPA